MRPELKRDNMRCMKELSFKKLRKIFSAKEILTEQLYRENEQQMCRLFQ